MELATYIIVPCVILSERIPIGTKTEEITINVSLFVGINLARYKVNRVKATNIPPFAAFILCFNENTSYSIKTMYCVNSRGLNLHPYIHISNQDILDSYSSPSYHYCLLYRNTAVCIRCFYS